MSRRYYPSLDGLRAVAILYVFGFHYSFPASPGYGFWGCGWIGVDFFFVLSGFLITGILCADRDGARGLGSFYARRVLRIFPLYYAVLFAVICYGLVMRTRFHLLQALWLVDLGNYAAYLTGYHAAPTAVTDILVPRDRSNPIIATGHLWSLCIEEQFYFVWPFVVYRVRSRVTLMRVCIAVLVAAPLCRLLMFYLAPTWMLQNNLIYRSLPTRMDALIMGALLNLLLQGAQRAWLERHRRTLLVAGFAPMLAFFALAIARGHDTGFTRGSPWSTALLYSIVDVSAAVLILTLIHEESRVARVFRAKPLLWLGGISYGFYIFHELPHVPLIWTAGKYQIPHPDLFVWGVGFLLSLALSVLSFRYFESPFLRLKRFLR